MAVRHGSLRAVEAAQVHGQLLAERAHAVGFDARERVQDLGSTAHETAQALSESLQEITGRAQNLWKDGVGENINERAQEARDQTREQARVFGFNLWHWAEGAHQAATRALGDDAASAKARKEHTRVKQSKRSKQPAMEPVPPYPQDRVNAACGDVGGTFGNTDTVLFDAVAVTSSSKEEATALARRSDPGRNDSVDDADTPTDFLLTEANASTAVALCEVPATSSVAAPAVVACSNSCKPESVASSKVEGHDQANAVAEEQE
jgi:hypothetical protein